MAHSTDTYAHFASGDIDLLCQKIVAWYRRQDVDVSAEVTDFGDGDYYGSSKYKITLKSEDEQAEIVAEQDTTLAELISSYGEDLGRRLWKKSDRRLHVTIYQSNWKRIPRRDLLNRVRWI